MPAYDSQERRSRGFRDISLSFEPHPVTKDITILRDTACIRTSVSNIVQTIRGERFFNEFFGSNVRSSFFEFVDFATVNVSSPNTENLRQLQSERALRELLNGVMASQDNFKSRVPVFLKIAPDL